MKLNNTNIAAVTSMYRF